MMLAKAWWGRTWARLWPTGRLVWSIRVKGALVFTALILYMASIAVFSYHEKELLLHDFEAIQDMLETESLLKEADVSTFHAVMAVFAGGDASDPAARIERIRLHYEDLLQREGQLRERIPEGYINLDGMRKAWGQVRREASTAALNNMVAELVETKNDLAAQTERVQTERQAASRAYREKANSVAATVFLLGMLGLASFGAVIGLFFRHLVADLRRLQERALAIVKGYRGAPLVAARHDEVGQLITAINSMAETLDQKEKEEILKRQKIFHQEKMAAIGTLAAGVAHEIGNPIAAISGIAQDMVARRTQGAPSCGADNCYDCRPDLIHEQTQRLAAITREIAEFASPRAANPEFMDLNGQLRTASSLIRYDARLRNVSLSLDLDPQLPAIYAVADQVTQVVMNLLINAMDALEGVQDRMPELSISTCESEGRACLTIGDNGCGMDAVTLDRAFEAFYTTKPAGKGTGLGLSLCYAIVKKHGGSIEIASAPGAGCKVTVYFPLNDTSYNEADPL